MSLIGNERLIQDALAHLTPADLEQVIPTRSWDGRERPARSRQWMIWHVLEHEIHHGGELSLALGGLGLPGVYGNA